MGQKCCSCCLRQKGGKDIPDSSHFTKSVTDQAAQVIIHGASSQDSGTYTAVVTRQDGTQARAAVALQVRPSGAPTKVEAPTFVRTLRDLAVKVGTRVRFLVELRAAHNVQVYWYHGSVELKEDASHRILHEGNFFCVDISPVTLDDEGGWRCVAENMSGQETCSACLQVVVPKGYKRPVFLEDLDAILTSEGTVSLECKVVGVPTPVLRWYKDGEEIKAGDVFALKADPEDENSLGTYTCEAVNCMGRAVSSSRVRVLAREGTPWPPSRKGEESPVALSGPPPIFTEKLTNQKVKIGEKVTFAFTVNALPEVLTVTWYSSGRKIEPSDKYRPRDEGGGRHCLDICPAEMGDDGPWKAVVKTEGGYAATACNLTLTVPRNYRAPRFLEVLKALLTEEGLVSFECKVVGYPTPVLQWFKDGNELKPGDVYQLSGTNSLGKYSCIAKNCMGEALSTAELTLEDIKSHLNEEEKEQLLATNIPPKFIQGLQSAEVKIGEPLTLTVQVTVTPPPQVVWYHEDEVVSSESGFVFSQEEPGFFRLTIDSMSIPDQGEWKCMASNDFGHSVTAASVKLSIPRHYKKPVFLEPLRAVLSQEGTVNLECKVIGAPQPLLKWYKDGSELKPGDIHAIISGEGGTCCLGTYTCEAVNCMGLASSSAALLGFEEKMMKTEPPSEGGAHDMRAVARHPSLSTINEERSSQISFYESVVSDASVVEEEKAEVSVSIEGRDISLSLYETPDLSEAEAIQIAEIYAEEISDHLSVHDSNQGELPPLRFTKQSSRKGPLQMEAMVIDVEKEAFEEYMSIPDICYDDLRTEADIEEMSAMEAVIIDEREALRSDIAELPEVEIVGEENISARTVSTEGKGVANIQAPYLIESDLRTLNEQDMSFLQTHAYSKSVSNRRDVAMTQEPQIMYEATEDMPGHELGKERKERKEAKLAAEKYTVSQSVSSKFEPEPESLKRARIGVQPHFAASAEQQQPLSQAESFSDFAAVGTYAKKSAGDMPFQEALGITSHQELEMAKTFTEDRKSAKRMKRTPVEVEAKEPSTVGLMETYSLDMESASNRLGRETRAKMKLTEKHGYQTYKPEVKEDIASCSYPHLDLQKAQHKEESLQQALITDHKVAVTEQVSIESLEKAQQATIDQISAAGVALQYEPQLYTAVEDIPEMHSPEETEADFSDIHSLIEPLHFREQCGYEIAGTTDDREVPQYEVAEVNANLKEPLAISTAHDYSQTCELPLSAVCSVKATTTQILHEAFESFENIGISGDVRDMTSFVSGISDRANILPDVEKEALLVQEADVDLQNLSMFNKEDVSEMLTVAYEGCGPVVEHIVVQEPDLQVEATIVSQRPEAKPEMATAAIVEGVKEIAMIEQPPVIEEMSEVSKSEVKKLPESKRAAASLTFSSDDKTEGSSPSSELASEEVKAKKLRREEASLSEETSQLISSSEISEESTTTTTTGAEFGVVDEIQSDIMARRQEIMARVAELQDSKMQQAEVKQSETKTGNIYSQEILILDEENQIKLELAKTETLDSDLKTVESIIKLEKTVEDFNKHREADEKCAVLPSTVIISSVGLKERTEVAKEDNRKKERILYDENKIQLSEELLVEESVDKTEPKKTVEKNAVRCKDSHILPKEELSVMDVTTKAITEAEELKQIEDTKVSGEKVTQVQKEKVMAVQESYIARKESSPVDLRKAPVEKEAVVLEGGSLIEELPRKDEDVKGQVPSEISKAEIDLRREALLSKKKELLAMQEALIREQSEEPTSEISTMEDITEVESIEEMKERKSFSDFEEYQQKVHLTEQISPDLGYGESVAERLEDKLFLTDTTSEELSRRMEEGNNETSEFKVESFPQEKEKIGLDVKKRELNGSRQMPEAVTLLEAEEIMAEKEFDKMYVASGEPEGRPSLLDEIELLKRIESKLVEVIEQHNTLSHADTENLEEKLTKGREMTEKVHIQETEKLQQHEGGMEVKIKYLEETPEISQIQQDKMPIVTQDVSADLEAVPFQEMRLKDDFVEPLSGVARKETDEKVCHIKVSQAEGSNFEAEMGSVEVGQVLKLGAETMTTVSDQEKLICDKTENKMSEDTEIFQTSKVSVGSESIAEAKRVVENQLMKEGEKAKPDLEGEVPLPLVVNEQSSQTKCSGAATAQSIQEEREEKLARDNDEIITFDAEKEIGKNEEVVGEEFRESLIEAKEAVGSVEVIPVSKDTADTAILAKRSEAEPKHIEEVKHIQDKGIPQRAKVEEQDILSQEAVEQQQKKDTTENDAIAETMKKEDIEAYYGEATGKPGFPLALRESFKLAEEESFKATNDEAALLEEEKGAEAAESKPLLRKAEDILSEQEEKKKLNKREKEDLLPPPKAKEAIRKEEITKSAKTKEEEEMKEETKVKTAEIREQEELLRKRRSEIEEKKRKLERESKEMEFKMEKEQREKVEKLRKVETSNETKVKEDEIKIPKDLNEKQSESETVLRDEEDKETETEEDKKEEKKLKENDNKEYELCMMDELEMIEQKEKERLQKLGERRKELEKQILEDRQQEEREEAERKEQRKLKRLEEEKQIKLEQERLLREEEERQQKKWAKMEEDSRELERFRKEREKRDEEERQERKRRILEERRKEERLMEEESEKRKLERKEREVRERELLGNNKEYEERQHKIEQEKKLLQEELQRREEKKREHEEYLRTASEELLRMEEERRLRKHQERHLQEEEDRLALKRLQIESEERVEKEKAERGIKYTSRELIVMAGIDELLGRKVRRELPERPAAAPTRKDPRRRPRFSTKLQDRQAVKGTRVRISCNVLYSSEDGHLEVEWFKSGYPVKENERVKTFFAEGVASLELENVSRADSGEYTCSARNRHGRVSTSCDIRVKGEEEQKPSPPTFTTALRERYVAEDDELILSCHVIGYPQPKITWLKDSDKLVTSPRFQTTQSNEGVCQLVISSPRVADSGVFTCHAENRVYRDEISTTVRVQALLEAGRKEEIRADDSEAARFVSELCDQKVLQNGTLTLQVEIAGNPNPEVLWLFNGRTLPPTGKFRISASGKVHTLTVFQITPSDIGTYSCRIENKYGHAYTMSTVTFGLQKSKESESAVSESTSMKAPAFVVRPESMLTVLREEEIRLSCTILGEPTPRVTWKKGSHDISNLSRTHKTVKDNIHTLVLRSAQFSDSGTYTVEAKNAHGSVRAYCSVKVREAYRSKSYSPRGSEEPYPASLSSVDEKRLFSGRFIRDVPAKVEPPRATDIGKNWLSLQWQKPYNTEGAPVTAYKVEAWILGEEARWQELGVSLISTFDAYNLKQDREYLFRITPRNKYGWGEAVMTPRPIRVGRIIEHPNISRALPSQVRCMPGGCISIEAQVTGDPVPEIKWYKDGTHLEVSRYPRFTSMLSEGSVKLNIDDMQRDDEGRYELEAVNPGGRVTSCTRLAHTNDCSVLEAQQKINRNLQAVFHQEEVAAMAPQFTMRLRDRRVQVGFPVRLTCQIVGVPKPEVTWFKDGVTMCPDEAHAAWQEDGHFYTLEISNSKHEDAAQYSVQASNYTGAVMCKCRLVVDSGLRSYISPMFLKELEDMSAAEGSTIKLETMVEAYPTIGVVWHRDGQRIRSSRKHSFDLDCSGLASLTIRDAEYTDGGLYTCTATNDAGHIQSICRVSVTCTDPDAMHRKDSLGSERGPMFVRRPRTIDAEESDLVIIECEVRGDPKPTVTWMKDWIRTSDYSEADRFQQVGTGPVYRLEIPACQVEDTGAYSIVAKNDHGERRAIISLQVYAKGLKNLGGSSVKSGAMESIPVVLEPLQEIRCCDGDSIAMETLIDAPETSCVRWEKDGRVLKDCGDLQTSWDGSKAKLRVREVYPEDEGEYSCIVFNDMGKTATSAALIVELADDKENDVTVQLEHRPDLSRRTTPSRTSTPSSRYSRSPSVGFSTRRFTPEPSPKSRARRSHGPKFYYIPHDKIVQEGETVAFQCAIKGNPTPKTSWDKDSIKIAPDGGRIRMEEKGEVRLIEIPKVTQQDAGLYRVTIENDLGREQATARLDVIKASGNKYASYVRSWHTAPLTVPRFTRTLPLTTARQGGKLSLSTDYKGSPAPAAKWYRNEELLPMCDDYLQTYDGRRATLDIPFVSSSDAGTYSCVITNEAGTARSSCQVTVECRKDTGNVPPYFLQGLQHSTVLDGDEVRLSVKLEGTKPLRVLWVKDSGECPLDETATCEEGEDGWYSLLLPDVYPRHSGVYICEAYNSHGEAFSYATLRVIDPRKDNLTAPKIIGALSPLEVKEGTAARFNIEVTGSPSPAVTWYTDGRPMEPSSRIKIGEKEEEGITRCSLGILSASPDDSGVITVSASSFIGYDSAVTHLKVMTETPVATDGADVYPSPGDPRLAPASPLLKKRHTFKESALVYSDSAFCSFDQSRSFSSCSGTLSTLSDLDGGSDGRTQAKQEVVEECRSDDGIYEQEDEDDQIGAEIISGPHDVVAMKGSHASLVAFYAGNPEPLVTWLKKDQELSSEGRYTILSRNGRSSLTISEVTPEDCDKYTVVVRNGLNAHAAFASLAVEGVPEPPADKPNLSEVTSTSVTLSWYGPTYDGGSAVIGYSVQARKIGQVNWDTLVKRCQWTSYKAAGLERGAQFEFRVRAMNVHGESDPSKVSNPVTLQDAGEDEAQEEADTSLPFKDIQVEVESGEFFLERYNMHEEIGKGRFGIVYKVSEKSTGHKRAAKIVKCIKNEDKQKVKNEIDIMNSLRHPKLLQLGAAFRRQRDMVMILEYIGGGELFERVVADDFALTEKESIIFMKQICEGVEYMHSFSTVHLDLKPENILCVSRTSHQIKLIDFGLACKLNPDSPCKVLSGTPEFIAPEVINFEPIALSSDMWSVGVICYVLLSGLSPFMGETDAETFANITRADYDFDDESFDAISEDARAFIQALLVKRKEKRLCASECLKHRWLDQQEVTMKKVVLPTDKLKKFIIRRKWQKTGNAIRALGRMTNLTNRRSSQPISPTRLSPLPENMTPVLTNSTSPSKGRTSLPARSSYSTVSERSDSGISECSLSVDDNYAHHVTEKMNLSSNGKMIAEPGVQGGKTHRVSWQSSVDSAISSDDFQDKGLLKTTRGVLSKESLIENGSAGAGIVRDNPSRI